MSEYGRASESSAAAALTAGKSIFPDQNLFR
jgi:hypothetical protein